MSGNAVQYHLNTILIVGLGIYFLFVVATWALFKLLTTRTTSPDNPS